MRNNFDVPKFGACPKGFYFLLLLAFLLLAPDARAGNFVTYGPEDYAGKTVNTKTFSVLNPSAAYTLHIDNGGVNGQFTRRVSSGLIKLNGVAVVRPSDFNQNVSVIEKALTLSANNRLLIDLTSTADSGITLQLIGDDTDQPVITAAVSPSVNAAGWHNSAATVSFTCIDNTSAITACTAPVTVTAEGAGQTVSGTAEDQAGNTATTSVTINLDKTPPIVTPSVQPLANGAGWQQSDVTVSFDCADNFMGIVHCTAPITITSEGAGQPVPGSAEDRAGNTATASADVNLDKTPPTVTITSPADGALLDTPIARIEATVADSLSGIAAVRCNGNAATLTGSTLHCDIPLQAGANALTVQATDNAGHTTASTINVTLSTTPSDIKIIEPANFSFFNLNTVTASGTVAANTTAVSINGIPATLSGQNWSASIPLQEGNNTLTAVATKTGGTTHTASIQVTLDTTPPRVTVATPTDGFNTSEDKLTVTGIVNDIVVGTVNSGQAQVSVNGIPADVANRTYTVADIPLQLGINNIQAIATDQVGNSATTTINVTRETVSAPVIKLLSGNNQSGAIGSALAEPFSVQLVNGQTPVANVPVIFKIVENDGFLTLSNGKKQQLIAVNTDAEGKAQATLTLGHRAGAGNNVVEAYATGYQGTALFSASGTPTPVAHINVDAGSNQFGAVGGALPLPFVAVVTDAGHNRLGGVPVTFTVTQGGGHINGQTTYPTVSDSDGRVLAVLTLGPDAGQDNNVVEAGFPDNPGVAAAFAASGKIPGDPTQTAISGVVQDNSNNPIAGVTMRLLQLHLGSSNNQPVEVATPVTTDANGQFKLMPAPVGFFKLMADGATATPTDKKYPTLEYDIVTVAGQDNGIGMPIYLPALDPAAKLCVNATTGGTLKMASSPGFSLTLKPGAATFPGGAKTGCVSVTPVNPDKVPMAPGFGQQPRYIVTIQPVGTTFNPPAAITIPNMDGLAPHAKTEMYSYDHDLAAFVAIGTASVSADGSVIASDPGIGVIKAGWHCGGDPNVTGSSASLGVLLTATPSAALVGATIDFTAKGAPALDGVYENWEIIDNPSSGKFSSMPSCPSQKECVNKLNLAEPGTMTSQVSFRCTTTNKIVTSEPVKVQAVKLTVKSVSFSDDITIFKDISGGGTPEIKDPVWKSSNSPEENNPVAYVRNSQLKMTAVFEVDPVPKHPIDNLTIIGEVVGLGKFRQENIKIPADDSVTAWDIVVNTPLPGMTKFYGPQSPMVIKWQYEVDGKTQDIGQTQHTVYVTLAQPNNHEVYLTTLHLAVSKDGAEDKATAFRNTWAQFEGPANVKSWDDKRLLYYYKDGVGFSGCALYENSLLTQSNGSSQCGAWALLMQGALAINGIDSEIVQINPYLTPFSRF